MDFWGVVKKSVSLSLALLLGTRCGYVSSTKLSVGTSGANIVAIGQKDEFSFDGRFGGVGTELAAFAKIQDKFYLSNITGGRVLVFDQAPVRGDVAPIFVLGKTSFQDIEDVPVAEISAFKMGGIYSFCNVGNRLYMVDTKSYRILGWNSLPTRSGQPADFVIGQSNFTNYITNNGSRAGNTFNNPWNCATDGTRLYVADYSNHRVLIWNQAPTENTPADIVLGQTDFVSGSANAGGARGPSTLNLPQGLMIHNSKLYVADRGNRRVLVWNTLPTTNFAPADVVIGQADFTSVNTTPSASVFAGPVAMEVHEGKLFVSDLVGYRILGFNTIPTSNGATADLVLCQPDFTSVSNNYSKDPATISRACGASALVSENGKLIISDMQRFRLIGFNSSPTSNFQAFDFVWGQPNTSSTQTMGSPVGPHTLRPSSATVIDDKLVVSDSGNNRIVIFNEPPKASFANADQVLFQPDFYSSQQFAVSAQTLSLPASVKSDGTKIYLVDRGNHRVLIWNNRADFFQGLGANIVLGQPDFTSNLPQQGLAAPTAFTLSNPSDVMVENGKVAVADQNNHRILIWNSVATNNQPADLVLGQADFMTNSANTGGRSSSTLNEPAALEMCYGKFLASDLMNHRVLVWNSWPTSVKQAANLVIGQAEFTSAVTSDTTTSFNKPRFPGCADNMFLVPDSLNKRIALWSSFPIQNGPFIEKVYGRESPSSSGPIYTRELSASKFKEPLKVLKWRSNWVIVDQNRILIYKTPPF